MTILPQMKAKMVRWHIFLCIFKKFLCKCKKWWPHFKNGWNLLKLCSGVPRKLWKPFTSWLKVFEHFLYLWSTLMFIDKRLFDQIGSKNLHPNSEHNINQNQHQRQRLPKLHESNYDIIVIFDKWLRQISCTSVNLYFV